MADITADEVAAAEADLVSIKSRRNVSAEDKRAAAESVAALRRDFRVQEEQAGRRSLGHTVSVED